MSEKNTQELEDVLGKTHISEFNHYCKNNKESMVESTDAFSTYIKELFRTRGITQQSVFLKADIPERYGYKLLSGEKHTKQRDIILRICYAAELTLEETQRALKKYEMSPLYAKIPRDALVMIMFNERPGGIIEVNELLKQHGMEALRTSGLQD
jgi:hypothetical protein